MNKIYMECQVKAVGSEMEFSAYGNVKNIVDHALDVAMDGCYQNSIANHMKNGTMPKLFWAHDARALPVGKINRIEEDSKGLFFEGKISKTTMGNDLYILAKDNAIDSFSIGYRTIKEMWNNAENHNELHEIDIKEISFVNFACNEQSTMEEIKSAMTDGNLPTVRELERFLREGGLSRKQAMSICSHYSPKSSTVDLESVKDYSIFK